MVAITSKFCREQLGQAIKLMPRERSFRLFYARYADQLYRYALMVKE